MKYKSAIVWFRNDLRLHDHTPLYQACQSSQHIVPVYCFDPRQFGKQILGLDKTGAFRAKFLLEAVDNLKKNLNSKGSRLLVFQGKPEDIIPDLAKEFGSEAVYFSEETTSEELHVESAVEKSLWKIGVETQSFWQSTLFHLEDLPFPINQTPEVFTQFRKACEKYAKVRPSLPIPEIIPFPKNLNWEDEIPDLSTLGFQDFNYSSDSALDFIGGDSAALNRLEEYFWKRDLLKVYKQTRNGLIGADYSSKFSPWLALGCISPRYIYEEVKRYEQERKKNDSTYWLIFELIWRDYFRFIAKKHGDKIFKLEGIKGYVDKWSQNEKIFWKWANGETGIPFIDANMRELNATGFMSNRGRQNVASFLVNDLGINWTWGAAYFESLLIDYDVCSNWGNWLYVAGVGNDLRENRYFNTLRQAHNYDRSGDYIRRWISELAKIPGFDIHRPFALSTSESKEYNIQLGVTYPHPIVKLPEFD